MARVQDIEIDLCHDCGGEFSSSGEGLALLIVVVAAIPLAILGIVLATTSLPERRARPWIARAVYVALVAQCGCLVASLFVVALAAAMLIETFGAVGALIALPFLLHPALNAGGIAAWRKLRDAGAASSSQPLTTLK